MNTQFLTFRQNRFVGKVRENKTDKFVFYLCLIDVLFIPYAFFIAISYSFFVLLPWLFVRYHDLNYKYKDFKLYLGFSALAVVSTVIGIVAHGSPSENISRCIQIIQILGYFFMFRYYLDEHSVNIKSYLLLFCVFVVSFCAIYNVDKSLYVQIIQFWNPCGLSSTASLYTNLIGYRYSFLWMDPNNIAYMFVGIIAFIITNEKTEMLTNIILIIGLTFVLISAMSSGGFLSAGIEVAVLVIFRFMRKAKRGRFLVVKMSSFITLCLSPAIVYGVKRIWDFYSQSLIAIESFERISGNSADSRLEIWNRILNQTNFFLYILIGFGGVTYVAGRPQKPHNGHLYIILAFGFIAYFIFLYIVFRKRHITPLYNYIWIISVFLGFTANVLVGEVKLSAVIMLLAACASSEKYLSDRKHIQVEETD